MMPGDRLIELYAEVHRLRADLNEACATGDRTAEFQAQARLRDVQSSIDYHMRDPEKTPAVRRKAPYHEIQLNTPTQHTEKRNT